MKRWIDANIIPCLVIALAVMAVCIFAAEIYLLEHFIRKWW